MNEDSSELETRPLYTDEELTYRNSKLKFLKEPLVILSCDYAPGGNGSYYYLEKVQNKDRIGDSHLEVKVNPPELDTENVSIVSMELWPNHK